jgi:pimeloyl-ACP methyl ester carboxylesterase
VQSNLPRVRADEPTIATDIAHEEGWLTHQGQRFCHRVIRHPSPAFSPTLFVSGAFQTMESWARFARIFAQSTTVILVDPPGMGRSEPLPPEYGVDFLADCLFLILEEHGIERINVVAASYGTPAAYRLAQRYPERIERVVLAGTMKEIPSHIRGKVQESIETALYGDGPRLAQQVIDGLLCRDLGLPVEKRGLSERILRSSLSRMSARELRQYAANTTRLLEHEALDLRGPIIGPQALIFTGEHDCFTTPEHCLEVAKAFQRAWFTVIERADHLFHVERFDVIVDLLLRFMQGTLRDDVPGCGPLVRLSEPILV